MFTFMKTLLTLKSMRLLTAGVVSRGTSHAKTAEAARRIRRVLEEMT